MIDFICLDVHILELYISILIHLKLLTSMGMIDAFTMSHEALHICRYPYVSIKIIATAVCYELSAVYTIIKLSAYTPCI